MIAVARAQVFMLGLFGLVAAIPAGEARTVEETYVLADPVPAFVIPLPGTGYPVQTAGVRIPVAPGETWLRVELTDVSGMTVGYRLAFVIPGGSTVYENQCGLREGLVPPGATAIWVLPTSVPMYCTIGDHVASAGTVSVMLH